MSDLVALERRARACNLFIRDVLGRTRRAEQTSQVFNVLGSLIFVRRFGEPSFSCRHYARLLFFYRRSLAGQISSMTFHRYGRRFFEVPHAAVYLLIAANFIAYSVCFYSSGAIVIPSELLLRSGAMYPSAISRLEYWRLDTYGFLHVSRPEYWRLITYGFLHANLFHITVNMFCLGLWGGHLERRVGSFYLFSIYICALISGAFFGVLTLPPQHLLIGASGAISGILGALLCLWVLGRIDLPASFFVINIGLNVAVLALNTSKIGWGSHLGGFAAGIISCALLDVLEKINAFVFRCKFPEFIKINGFIVVVGVAALFWGGIQIAATFRPEGWLLLFMFVIEVFGVIKLIDLVLSVKKGLAIIVIVFAAANAALVLVAGVTYTAALSATCASREFSAKLLENALKVACTNINLTLYIVAACAFVLTLVGYLHALFRGITDVGFVGATLRAERKRRQGI
jgi:membrane associated rhomboid family serine protease